MDMILGIVASIFLGYLISKLEKIEGKLNNLEDDLILLKASLPKRKNDLSE